MNAVALMYHDVAAAGDEDSTGFPGGDAARYKLTPDAFSAHLHAIRDRIHARPTTANCLAAGAARPVLITFDDGGASAVGIADCLDAFGWPGHFFVTTAYIDRPGFLTRGDIRALRARGHVVGSHSCTHPLRMAGCSTQRIQDEWSRSVATLADILGERIEMASVPGGDHSPRVADAAAAAGVRVLFTSRPTIAVQVQDDLLVVGRFAIRRSTSPARAAAVAAGASTPRLAQMLLWDLKAIGKTVAGPTYRRLRARRLGASDRVRWGDDLASVSEDPS